MATSYSREQIVDLAMQMLGGGASLDDVIKAAANYDVDLASVYYSDPGTLFSVATPADTGPVDTGPVDTGPIYSEPDDSGFEDVIVDPRSGSSGSGPVQSPLSTVSSPPPESSAATAPESSAAPATSPAISNEDINKYIQSVLSSGVSQQEAANQINAAAVQYGVSRDQIAGATGYDLDVVNQYLGALPTTNASPLSTVSADKVLSNQGVTSQSPLSLLSADERQQSAIDSATVKPQDTAGYYQGVQIPTFTDRTVYQGGGEDGGIFESAAQQLASWQTEQDRRAALTPAQRAIEDARYDIQGEGSTATAYNTVIVGGKEYTVAGDGSNLVRISDNQSGLGAKQTRYDMLDPVTGKITQEIGVEGPGLWKNFLTNPVTGLILGVALPGLGSAIGSALGATGAAAGALGSGVLNFGLQVAAGADPIDALKGAVLSAGAGFAGAQVSSMLPTELASAGKNAVTQLITTGKLDPAALATSVGTSFATDALAAETGVDRATAAKLVTAGLQALQGNELAALTSLAQAGLSSGKSTVIGALGTDTTSGAAGRDVVDEYNVTGGGGALITSGNPTEDQQIAIRQRQNAVNQALTDYVGPGNDLSREGLVSQLQSLGLTADQAEGYAQQADQKINMDLVGADVRFKYSKIDPEFGTPQLDRDTAVRELVTAGYSSDRANQILNDVDAENASKLENRLNVQVAYNDLIRGTGTIDQLRSAMMLAGYTDAQINNQVTKGLGILEGSKLTAGEQAQERAANLPDIRAEIAGKSSFNDAYALAREKLGPGATFTWQGKDYVASSAAERPDLTGTKTGASTSTATTDVPYIAPNGMHNRAAFIQAGGGTSDADYAKYVQAVNALVSEGKSGTLITPASVNSAGKELPSTKGSVTMEKPRVDSVLGSVAAQGVASFGANSIAGTLSALGFTDAGRTVLDKANQIAAAATAAEGADITQGKKDINTAIQKVGESTGIKEFATNVGDLVSTAFKNPKAFGATVGSEVVEEVLQLATVKFPGSFLVKETVASALENGGAAYNTEYESQIAKGASKEDAHLAAQKAAGTAAGVTVALAGGAAGLGKVAGKVIGSQADEVPTSGVSQVGKTTLKESAQETIEEGSIAGAIDLALGRPVDAVNVLTNMTGGALYGGPTSGVMQGTKLDMLDQGASTSIGSGIQASFNNTLAQTGDIVQASTGSVTTAINNGLNPGAAVSTVISTAAQSGNDMSTVISSSIDTGLSTALSSGVDASEAVSTIVSGSITSSLSSGVDVTTAIDSTVGSSVKTGIATGADASTVVTSSVSSAVSTALNNGASVSTVVTGAVNSAVTSGLAAGANASTVIASSVTAAVSTATQSGADATAVVTGSTSTAVSTAIASGVDASTAVGSAVTAAIDAGANASVAAASSITAAIAAGTDINTAIAAATNANSNVTANSTTNNNVITTTATDTNTGVTTQTSVNTNTNTTTTTTTNNNVTTQVTTAGSTTTTVTSDVNTGLTTQTTVDTNTNTTTKITVNTNTDEVVVKVTDSSTGEVIDTQIKTVDELTPSEREKLTITDPTTKTPVTKTPVTKPPVATAPKTGSSAGFSMFGEIGRLSTPMLKSAGDTQIRNPLEQLFQSVDVMNQIDPALLAVMAQRLNIQPEQAPTFTYGQETSIDDILGLRDPEKPKMEEALYAEGGYVEPLRAKPMNLQFMNRGGALPGGREDFKGGKHVAGDGDGQSDDIPAWLADGEFVFPADVVSALGNGSTKAGTDKLYKMMHEIRARARSTKVKDLPPPAHKSPLDYIKKGK